MNNNIRNLYKISSKKTRTIIGLMSGTSLDGLDIALCSISGSGHKTKVALKSFTTIPYDDEIRRRILSVFAKPVIEFQLLSELNAWLALKHASMITSTLKRWRIKRASVDVVASHGQTVFHAPMAITRGVSVNSTLQIGDGDHMAVATGIITLSDFRQKHIAGGGEGAPLAVYGDYLLFSKKNEDRIMLNIGGIGNFTFLPGSLRSDKVFVTDTGPGNTMIDQAMRHFFQGKPFDKNAEVGLSGDVNPSLLSALKSNSFFSLPFPKTTGPEQFNMEYLKAAQQQSNTTSIAVPDIIATLTRFSAETICDAISLASGKKRRQNIFLSGGGAHNPLIVKWIKELVPDCTFSTTTVLGIDGDAKEAVLFAVLANEALAGGKIRFGNRHKVPSVSMGKVSFPK
ncbi:MAG TPA: anhydro-N-acetylmuramic acid kinase [Cyclobacteriaceae bacterium]|nr:anhydro-N-acetylmuramic acid kinase [Cyclobacteriaceae bacterium]